MTGENKSLLFKLQCIARYDLKIIASDLYLCFDSMISADATGLLIDALKCLSIDAREWLLRDLYEYAKQKKLLVKLANVYHIKNMGQVSKIIPIPKKISDHPIIEYFIYYHIN